MGRAPACNCFCEPPPPSESASVTAGLPIGEYGCGGSAPGAGGCIKGSIPDIGPPWRTSVFNVQFTGFEDAYIFSNFWRYFGSPVYATDTCFPSAPAPKNIPPYGVRKATGYIPLSNMNATDFELSHPAFPGAGLDSCRWLGGYPTYGYRSTGQFCAITGPGDPPPTLLTNFTFGWMIELFLFGTSTLFGGDGMVHVRLDLQLALLSHVAELLGTIRWRQEILVPATAQTLQGGPLINCTRTFNFPDVVTVPSTYSSLEYVNPPTISATVVPA